MTFSSTESAEKDDQEQKYAWKNKQTNKRTIKKAKDQYRASVTNDSRVINFFIFPTLLRAACLYMHGH